MKLNVKFDSSISADNIAQCLKYFVQIAKQVNQTFIFDDGSDNRYEVNKGTYSIFVDDNRVRTGLVNALSNDKPHKIKLETCTQLFQISKTFSKRFVSYVSFGQNDIVYARCLPFSFCERVFHIRIQIFNFCPQ